MKNNKGFTLIELLAVIVILAVIILMITPRILQIIEKSKKNTFETTANSLLRTTKQFYANAIVNQDNKVYEFSFEEGKKGETIDGDKLELSGTLPTEGRIVLSPNGKIDIRVSNDEYSACKGYDDYAVVVLTKAEGFLCGVNEDGSTSNNPITAGQLSSLEEKYEELREELDIAKQEIETLKTNEIDTNSAINNINSTFLSKTYPVGSIYISTSNQNPGTGETPLFPDTTWVAWGTGRTLVGVDTAQSEFNTVEKTGGSKTHALTIAQMPSHTHDIYTNKAAPTIYSTTPATAGASLTGSEGAVAQVFWSHAGTQGPRSIVSTGGGEAHNNLQPYITVYMWKRVN